MRPCQHCGRAIGLKEPICPYCRREQAQSVPLVVASVPATRNSAGGPRELERADAVLRRSIHLGVAALVILATTGGYLFGGVAGALIAAFFTGLLALLVVLNMRGCP